MNSHHDFNTDLTTISWLNQKRRKPKKSVLGKKEPVILMITMFIVITINWVDPNRVRRQVRPIKADSFPLIKTMLVKAFSSR